MTLSEKIAALRAEMVAEKDALQALAVKDMLDASEKLQQTERTDNVLRLAQDLEDALRAEKALGVGAMPIDPSQAPRPAAKGATGGAPAIVTNLRKATGFDLLVRTALVAFESHVTHLPVDMVAERRYPNMLDVAEASKMLSNGPIEKAAVNPALTTVAGWAAELVREGYGAFMDALAPESVLPRLPLTRYEFDGYGKIHLPARQDRYPASPNLAGFFRAEGAPIRVGRTTLVSKFLTPKSAGVIGTFSKELLRRSTPNIEAAIRQWMLEDTAIAMDTLFLDAVAGDNIRPAGIQNGIDPADTAASGGNTGSAIVADVSARLKQLSSHGLGRRPVWVMNQAHAWGLAFSKTPTGEAQFPEAANGQLAGIPIVASTTVPMDLVFLIDAAEIGFAGGSPSFEGTDVATIHEDDGAPNTDGKTGATVLPIATGAAGAAVVATPVRSLYQTHSAAIKAYWELDWAVMRPGAVQVITGVGW